MMVTKYIMMLLTSTSVCEIPVQVMVRLRNQTGRFVQRKSSSSSQPHEYFF